MSTDSKETPRDQPTDVATEEAPRPPENAIVTSDVEPPPEPRSAGAEDSDPAAAADEDGPNDAQDPAPGDDDKQNKPRNRSAERRIKRLTGKLSRAEAKALEQARRIEEQERELARLRAATPKPAEPKLEDFRTPAEYARAFAKWEKDVATLEGDPEPRRQAPARQEPAQQQQQPASADQAIEAFHKRGQEQLGDEFLEALQDEGTAVSQSMAEFLFDTDAGPAIYVHLANNQEESRKIYDLPAHRQVKALEALEAKAKAGKLDIEGQLQFEEPEPEPEPAPPRAPSGKRRGGGSRAPTPPSSTRDAGSPNLQPDPENESMDDYAARRLKEERRRMGYTT